jgi:hypothetical protein
MNQSRRIKSKKPGGSIPRKKETNKKVPHRINFWQQLGFCVAAEAVPDCFPRKNGYLLLCTYVSLAVKITVKDKNHRKAQAHGSRNKRSKELLGWITCSEK